MLCIKNVLAPVIPDTSIRFQANVDHTQPHSNQLFFKEDSRTLSLFPPEKNDRPSCYFFKGIGLNKILHYFPLVGTHLLQAVALFCQSLQGAVIVLSNQRQSYEKKIKKTHKISIIILLKRRQHQKRGEGANVQHKYYFGQLSQPDL